MTAYDFLTSLVFWIMLIKFFPRTMILVMLLMYPLMETQQRKKEEGMNRYEIVLVFVIAIVMVYMGSMVEFPALMEGMKNLSPH